MSSLAKFFVVLVAFLCVCFLATSATLYQTQKNWKLVAEETRDRSVRDVADLKAKIETATGIIAAQHVSIEDQKNLNIELRTENDALKNKLADRDTQISKLDGEKGGMTNQISRKDGAIQDKDQEIARLTADNTKFQEEREKAHKDKTQAELDLARVILDKQQIDEQAKHYQEELTKITEDRDSQALLIRAIEKQFPNVISSIASRRLQPPLDGVVVSARDGVVVLSIGKGPDRVEEGYKFTVYRGSSFVAMVEVTNVTEDMAAAKILYPEAAKIQTGDLATTKL